jgi:hypothetical protein
MPTYNATKNTAGYPESMARRMFVLENKIDFTDDDVFTAALTTSDTVTGLNVPADCIVMQVWGKVETAADAAMTATLGDGSDADGWITNVAFSAAAGTVHLGNGAYVAAGGKLYSSADTLDFDLGGTATNTGVYTVRAFVLRA